MGRESTVKNDDDATNSETLAEIEEEEVVKTPRESGDVPSPDGGFDQHDELERVDP